MPSPRTTSPVLLNFFFFFCIQSLAKLSSFPDCTKTCHPPSDSQKPFLTGTHHVWHHKSFAAQKMFPGSSTFHTEIKEMPLEFSERDKSDGFSGTGNSRYTICVCASSPLLQGSAPMANGQTSLFTLASTLMS